MSEVKDRASKVWREEDGTWAIDFSCRDDYGRCRRLCRGGFRTPAAAEAYERAFRAQASGLRGVSLSDFATIYLDDLKPRVRHYTWIVKRRIIENKITPSLGTKTMDEIAALDIVRWQNALLTAKTRKGTPYADTYVRTVDNQLRALFSHGERFYGLTPNPVRKVPRIGSKTAAETRVWTCDEYLRFAETLSDDELLLAFELLYWTGMRKGELLALTAEDFDLDASTVRVEKSYQRLERRDVVTPPKTEKSNRTIVLPRFLRDEARPAICRAQGSGGRLFQNLSRHDLETALRRGTQAVGNPVIRLHDLRHSHVSLLMDMGFSVTAIGERLGHESAAITCRYAHLFPSAERRVGEALDALGACEGRS